MKREFPILNYPGSKRNLLDFINKNMSKRIPEDKVLFDIFAGSGSVSYFYKDRFQIYANDAEKYSSVILNALLNFKPVIEKEYLIEKINFHFNVNKNNILGIFEDWFKREEDTLLLGTPEEVEELYGEFPNVWKMSLLINNEIATIDKLKSLPFYLLFTTYYSGSYFGIKQSAEIDSIRYAIETLKIKDETKCMLLSSLFFAMKEAIFSKDGHMAQPLNLGKNMDKLLKKRNISIMDKFIGKLYEFYSDDFILSGQHNKVFNFTFEELLKKPEIFSNVGFIYADPPYTDMQYSRYFHLLNTLVYYDYPEMSIYRGKLSKGLYTENRYQSPLSQKSQALNYQIQFFEFCKQHKIGLGFSFAYPADIISQQTNRYVLNIFELIDQGKKIFGKNFEYFTQDYSHSNNRNSSSKKVLEYLLIYTPKF
ncbi:DNA adenine methylase [Margalitia sp. FSL K6-0131]|uniref:DNA adenine methylase n=1 Tax=Margalitia sp. FSL K6-0131 TaxID=2954604 RepID=UPI0030F882EF